MPKMTLEFSLPEERIEARLAEQGAEYYIVLFTLRETYIRRGKDAETEPEARAFYDVVKEIDNEVQYRLLPHLDYSLG
jgi:hypothetical protein